MRIPGLGSAGRRRTRIADAALGGSRPINPWKVRFLANPLNSRLRCDARMLYFPIIVVGLTGRAITVSPACSIRDGVDLRMREDLTVWRQHADFDR